MQQFHIVIFVLLFSIQLVASCDDTSTADNNTNNTNNMNNDTCTGDGLQCYGSVLQRCNGHYWTDETLCGIDGNPPFCDPVNLQCQHCYSGKPICGEDDNLHACTESGEVGEVIETCDPLAGDGCVSLSGEYFCDTPCERARLTPSYMGCDFWGTTTANAQLPNQFANNFGLAVDNSNDDALTIRIEGPSGLIMETIPARTIKVYQLPFQEEIRRAGSLFSQTGFRSGLYRTSEGNGAIHVSTTLPVTVYQFNPFDYTIDLVTSNSNDAAILLPTAVLTGNYMVMSRPSTSAARMGTQYGTHPGFATIVATVDNTEITFTSTAHVADGTDVTSLAPGETQTFSLNKGDVLQLVSKTDFNVATCPDVGTKSSPDADMFEFCTGGNTYDLTGSRVTASAPVAVFGGHNCSNVPYNYRACDHLEEFMFPLETWGSHFFVGLTHPVEELTSETNVVRILSGATQSISVTIEPSIHGTITLEPGEYFEFLPPQGNHLEITATGPILIGKFTVGQRYWTESQSASGDPAFGLVIPLEQYRNQYTFTTPTSMTVNYVNVIAPIPQDGDTPIILDGINLTADMYEPISGGYGIARVDVTAMGSQGSHSIHCPDESVRFGIEVYGFANYTSYLYPGGLDLNLINPME